MENSPCCVVRSILERLESGKTPNGADYVFFGNFGKTAIELIHLKKNVTIRRHRHRHTASVFYVIYGSGEIGIGKRTVSYSAGNQFKVPRMVFHAIQPKEETLFIVMETPPIENPATGKVDMLYG